MGSLTIGQVAKKAQVNVETVRYYERRGLIPKPPRRASGYRQYSEETIKRIRFIKHAKDLGFSLREILELLSLRVDAKTTCADIKNKTEAKILDIDAKISNLQRMRKALKKLNKECRGKGSVNECPILEVLEK